MIIYLYDKQKTDINTFLSQGDIKLWQKPQDVGNIEAWDKIGTNPLERVDAMIIEITEIDSQINYLLAQAILLQKNTLCLYKKNKPPRQLLTYLKKKNVPKCIQTKAYVSNNLKGILVKYIKSIKPKIKLEETPNIKYTLRITDSIEQYLNWKAKDIKINKADYIRNLIKKQLEEDQDFQKWLKNLG